MAQKRPKCPKCNGNRIISKGKSWKCKDCGRRFLKNRKPKQRKIPQKKPYVKKNPRKVHCCVCAKEFIIDCNTKEVGLFYCMSCLKKYHGKTVSDSSVVIPKFSIGNFRRD